MGFRLHAANAYFYQMRTQSYIANAKEIRKADQIMISEYDFPGLLLMESAGKQCADWILQHFPEKQLYVVLAGPGNNGGDGLVIARFLSNAGKVVVLLHSHDADRYQGDAKTNWEALKGAGIQIEKLPYEIPKALYGAAQNCLVIDALLGTGIKNELQGQIAELISTFQEIKAPIVAIDLPSGLDADTGEAVNQPLRAMATLTFQLPKVCHWVEPAASYCGDIVCFDIGIWPHVTESLAIKRALITSEYCRSLLKKRPKDGHKGTFGHGMVVGGSKAYPGAVALSGMATLQVGAGLATIFTTASARCAVYQDRPELMVNAWGKGDEAWLTKDAIGLLEESLAGKAAIAVGPGMGNEPESAELLQSLLKKWSKPLVIDADGLNQIASAPELWAEVSQWSILTPHPGEMKRLMPGFDVNNRRLEAAEKLSQQKQVIVVLKGAGTIVAMPNGRSFVNPTGNAGMATGGSGDVLTGVILGLLAQGYSPEDASTLGVYLHGLAGDLCAVEQGAAEAVTASGILGKLGAALAQIRLEK